MTLARDNLQSFSCIYSDVSVCKHWMELRRLFWSLLIYIFIYPTQYKSYELSNHNAMVVCSLSKMLKEIVNLSLVCMGLTAP